MGPGVAQVFAGAGHSTYLFHHKDIKKAQKGIDIINNNISRLVERGKMDVLDKESLLERIAPSAQMGDASSCDLVIEVIAEDLEVKKNFFTEIDKLCKPDVILATCTSSLSITELAKAVTKQERFIGLHFFNPAPVMKLVEIIKGRKTSDDTTNTIISICKSIGKDPIEIMDSPGFVVNRVLMLMINEAIHILNEGVASSEDIDTAMRLGAGHPIGPLALSDFIGNDIVLSIMNTIYDETGNSKFHPAPLLKKMVRAGRLGKKSTSGFYEYSQ